MNVLALTGAFVMKERLNDLHIGLVCTILVDETGSPCILDLGVRAETLSVRPVRGSSAWGRWRFLA